MQQSLCLNRQRSRRRSICVEQLGPAPWWAPLVPQERLKRLMAAQLNKKIQKDSVQDAQKKLQVGTRARARGTGACRACAAVGKVL